METKSTLKNVYKENLFIMKLLVTQPEFLEDVQKIRKKIKIPKNGFDTEQEKSKWLSKILEEIPADEKGLRSKKGSFFHSENLIKKYQLRYNFLHHVEQYLIWNKVDAPKTNFNVSLGPDPRGIRSNKWISIKAYAPLTKNEIREATKQLLKYQREFLPKKATLDLRPKMDIDLAIKIEQEMKKRFKIIEKKPSKYLEFIKKEYGEKEFKRVQKLNPRQMEKNIISYTSKDVAEKLLGNKDEDVNVRKTYSLLQKRRKQLFG